MEEAVQPRKKSNIPLIVAAALVVACLCSCVTLVLTVGVGFYLLDVNSVSSPTFPAYDAPAVEAYDPNLPQGGYGDNALRKRVWDFILPMAEEDANCQSPLPAAAVIAVTVEPDSSGVWEEGWTLFCSNGPTPVFRIIFSPNPDGTINFSPGIISK